MTLTDRTPAKHPAKFSAPILTEFDRLLARYGRGGFTLDPFAGVGRVHTLDAGFTVGIEIESDWAAQHPQTVTGNALHLPFPHATFQRVITSCTYGNRMGDCHDAKERCKPCKGSGEVAATATTPAHVCVKCAGAGRRHYKRNTYKHTIGHDLHPDNSGAMQWGPKYRSMHEAAWREAIRVLETGGHFFLNISDHVRDHKVIPVSDWHRETLVGLGLTWLETVQVATKRNKQGANYNARVPFEDIHVFQVPGVDA